MSGPSLDHVDLMFPNRYLKAADLRGKDWTGTIEKVELEELVRVGGQSETKPVVHFVEMAKRTGDDKKVFVLNKTNSRLVASVHGNKPMEWAGKRITLYPTKVKFGLDMVEAIRVRQPEKKRRGA